MARARVRVFIPTLDRRSLLLDTLRGLLAQTTPVEVVVVDNGSSDDSVETVRAELPDIHVLELGSNHGFGPALNAAVASHPAELLVFSNNDVLHEPRFVEAMLDELGSSTGSVAGVLLRHDEPRAIDTAGVIVDRTLLAFDYLHDLPWEASCAAEAPLGPTGGAALVRHSSFSAVGGFDERMFAYLEDVDLALRLRAAGFPCRIAPHARALHRHSATLGSGSAAKNRLMGWSRGYMLRRYGVLRSPRRAARALAAEGVICAGQAVIDRNVSGVAGRLRGWRAAAGLPRRPIPEGAATELTLRDALSLRAARRSRREASRTAEYAAIERAARD